MTKIEWRLQEIEIAEQQRNEETSTVGLVAAPFVLFLFMLRDIFRKTGYDIRKYPKPSVKTDRLTLHNTATGKYYLPTDAHQDIIAQAIKRDKVFEPEVLDIAKKYITPGSTVIDIGANFGQMSVLMSQLAGKVYSFEADDFVYRILCKNIKANERNNITSIYGAVHDTGGQMLCFPEQDFKDSGTYGSYGIDYNTGKGRLVESVTIDSLALRNVSFMKVDIQGGDLLAMKGAVETISKNRMPILFEFEYHLQDEFRLSFQDYIDFVNDIGYRFERVIAHNYLIVPN